VTTQRRLYPNSEPEAILAAQLPGSIKPTVTSRPGPIYFNRCRKNQESFFFMSPCCLAFQKEKAKIAIGDEILHSNNNHVSIIVINLKAKLIAINKL
jgi:hypothetical protein